MDPISSPKQSYYPVDQALAQGNDAVAKAMKAVNLAQAKANVLGYKINIAQFEKGQTNKANPRLMDMNAELQQAQKDLKHAQIQLAKLTKSDHPHPKASDPVKRPPRAKPLSKTKSFRLSLPSFLKKMPPNGDIMTLERMTFSRSEFVHGDSLRLFKSPAPGNFAGESRKK